MTDYGWGGLPDNTLWHESNSYSERVEDIIELYEQEAEGMGMGHLQTVRVMQTEQSVREQQHQLRVQQQLAEWYMSSQQYLDLNPQDTLGTVLIVNSVAQRSPWQSETITQIDQTIQQLKSDQAADTASITTATQLTAQGLSTPYHDKAADTLKQLYYLSPDSSSQAHVVGHLLFESARPILSDILQTPDSHNHLGAQFDAQTTERLLAISSIQADEPFYPNKALIELARDVLKPPSYPRSQAEHDRRIQNPIGLDGFHPNQAMMNAIEARNVDQIAVLLAANNQTSDQSTLAYSIATLDPSLAVPLKELLMAGNPEVKSFARETRQLIESQPDIAYSTADTGLDWAKLDATALTGLLLAPENTPAMLARRFGRTRKVQPLIIEAMTLVKHQ